MVHAEYLPWSFKDIYDEFQRLFTILEICVSLWTEVS